MKEPKKTKGTGAGKGTGDYEVGYGKPPVKNQFQKGNCANPNGRPKKRNDLLSIFDRVMGEKIAIKKDGISKSMSTVEALMMRLARDALAGNRGAMRDIISLLSRAAPQSSTEPGEAVLPSLTLEETHVLIKDYLAHHDEDEKKAIEDRETAPAIEGEPT
ncbi:DUF5681 domain-containing protein [Pseudohoeflea coraliihabitans]|uniref:DUF5681 domain-containing protein n=1 Tax=Pseudohoeflea coraliihabitans TaxID=2860393 RepID=A0ABS6WKT7_9HYPH|nr:DUF5681 domain-containing protein [Pseudohoeflea sp. DP4N28-3]MBW3096042.1 hypothetical protein [Pseudohoeflea sp. DP4N28-3]